MYPLDINECADDNGEGPCQNGGTCIVSFSNFNIWRGEKRGWSAHLWKE